MKELSGFDTKNKLTLIFVTETYPYGSGEQFIETEIRFTAPFFKQVIIIPKTGTGPSRPVPSNVSVITPELRRVTFSGWMHILSAVFRGFFWTELLSVLSGKFRLRSVRKFLRFTYQAYALKQVIQNLRLENHAVYYSYWLWSQAMALVLMQRSGRQGLFISRAHGYDVYEDQHSDRYLPYRRFLFNHLDEVYFVSQHGCDYTAKKHTRKKTRFQVARLGVIQQTLSTENESRPFVHIVSCSALIALKQIDLIIQGIALAEKETGILIHWTHIGDGELKDDLSRLAKELGVTANFTGALPNEQVFIFYRNHPVDLFVNASHSEGVPVSIMEAQSFGIPVIAPVIGGIPEIVSDENGALINPPVTPESIKQTICDYILRPDVWKDKRRRSFETWDERMNAERNYRSFGREIVDRYDRKYPG